MALVEGLHIEPAHGAHGTCDRARLRCAKQQVDVVVHQDVRVDEDRTVAASVAQQAAKVTPILVIDEDRAAVHATLGDVHWSAGDFDTGLAGHGLSLH